MINLLISIILIIFSLIVFKIFNLPKKCVIFGILSIVTMPINRMYFNNQQAPFALFSLLLTLMLWIIYSLKRTSSIIKYFSLLLIILISCLSVLYLNEIITQSFTFNYQRTFIIDNKYNEQILNYQKEALYLPYKLRPIIYGKWIFVFDVIERTFNWLWIDKFIIAFGIPILYSSIKGILKFPQRDFVIVFFVCALSGVIARNPNTLSIYFLLSPLAIILLATILPKINLKFFSLLILFGIIYQLIPS